VLYERDQAFGGAQLTQLIVRQYGFSPEEAEAKKRRRTARRLRVSVLRPFVEPGAGIGRALQFFFTSTPSTASITSCWPAARRRCRAGRGRDPADLVRLQRGQSFRRHGNQERCA
jgi:hypothetical protein